MLNLCGVSDETHNLTILLVVRRHPSYATGCSQLYKLFNLPFVVCIFKCS